MAINLTDEEVTPYWVHFGVQAVAFLASICLVSAFGAMLPAASIWVTAPVVTGAIALILSSVLGLPWWWKVIHSLFLPAALFARSATIPPEWYLWSFIFLFLVFRSATIGRIPLYFSGKHANRALLDLIRDKPNLRFIDLGAGIGSVTSHLARTLPRCDFTGVENSAIPWLFGRLRSLQVTNHHWIFGDFWRAPLENYDVVYAFLSPAPMARLWEKAQKEMRPSSLFITNTFRCPGTEPTFVIEIGGQRKAKLYCYAIPTASTQANPPARNNDHRLGPT